MYVKDFGFLTFWMKKGTERTLLWHFGIDPSSEKHGFEMFAAFKMDLELSVTPVSLS